MAAELTDRSSWLSVLMHLRIGVWHWHRRGSLKLALLV